MSPPDPKETPRKAVPAANQGKETSEAGVSGSDKPKFWGESKPPVEVRPGVQLRITRKGRIYRAGGVW